ncbi:MAG: helix-turn-helix transcriptional regulator [Flavobacteriales bacterium]|nr:helix-turn-helix transcriptional regulator [Flavobacteriales bacterium]
MNLSKTLKKAREAKGLSQKELAGLLSMPQPQYSRIESGKTDPSFSVVDRVATALGLSLSELFQAEEIFSDTNSYDKTLMEKLRLLDSLDEIEKKSIYNLIDSLVSKKKLKDNLSNLLAS